MLATAAALTIGTIVTGSGPHAGDKAADGTVRRTGLQVSSMAQLHADSVMVLIGLSVGLLLLLRALHAAAAQQRAAAVLLGVELAQGAIGYTQYFLHVPPLLVGLHMLGACLVWLAVLRVAVETARRSPRTRSAARADGQSWYGPARSGCRRPRRSKRGTAPARTRSASPGGRSRSRPCRRR